MPGEIPVGNGRILICFDEACCIRWYESDFSGGVIYDWSLNGD